MSEEKNETRKEERTKLLEMIERAIKEIEDTREALLAEFAGRNEKQ